MEYGITPDGFVKKTYDEIKQSLIEGYRSAFGIAIDTAPDSVIGQEIGVISKALADLWEVMLDSYNNRTMAGARGAGLQDLALQRNIHRIAHAASSVLLTIIANTGEWLTLPKGSMVKDESTTAYSWKTVDDLTLSQKNLSFAEFQLSIVEQNKEYAIMLTDSEGTNSREYHVLGLQNEKPKDLLIRLATYINNDESIAAKTNEDKITLFSQYQDECDQHKRGRFRASSSELTQTLYGNTVWADATITGKVKAPSLTINTIETPVTGWHQVTNLWNARMGSELESDVDLHQRLMNSFSTASAGTPEAIQGALLKIPGVTKAIVRQNTLGLGSATDEYMPPHSIAVLVESEQDNDTRESIIKAIARTKPAGIATWGNITGTYTPPGLTHSIPIKYSMTQEKYGHVKIEIQKTNKDLALPIDAIAQIQTAVIVITDKLSDGIDIPAQILYKAIYAIDGVGYASVKIAKTDKGGLATEPPKPPKLGKDTDWTEEILSVEPYETIYFALERIEIIIK